LSRGTARTTASSSSSSTSLTRTEPVLQLLYRLYASVMAIESTSKLDDEQWLAYWIIYSFLTLLKTVIQPTLEWYRGGKDHHDLSSKSPSGKGKNIAQMFTQKGLIMNAFRADVPFWKSLVIDTGSSSSFVSSSSKVKLKAYAYRAS
ncbi:hypothetical protein ABKV19_022601, partial [Rosa sericea]